jgi:adenine deaminase
VTLKIDELIAVARGQIPADLILTNARIVNVFTGEIERGNAAISGNYIAGIGDYRQAKETIDLKGKYLLPGLINGHVHIESSMLDVGQYARAVVPRGTTALITDLHEIANVCGIEGIRYILERAHRLPLDIFLMAPSCVPATHMETAGAELGIKEIRQLLRLKQCRGLGEVMNYPGVINSDKAVLDKIASAQGKVIDGHAPGLSGNDLNAYVSAGIQSDHESVLIEEAREKLSRGMHIMIREGSSEKNLETLLPLVNDETYRRCMLVVDDRSCVDILNDGDIDAVVRKAIRLGLKPVRAIQMASINTAEYFRLDRLGAVSPGYFANLIVTSDLATFPIDMVFYHGRLVGKDKQSMFSLQKSGKQTLTNTVKVKPFKLEALRLKAKGNIAPVIEIVPGQIVTKKRTMKVKIENGNIIPDIKRDILKLVVVERHKRTGNIGLGLVKGFGLKRGALASSIAHDSHNIVAVGTNDVDIYAAVKQIEKMQGGLSVVADEKVIASLPLPVAGLLSDESLETVVKKLANVEKAASELGVKLVSPFSTLSFVALPVIPELRLTDLGLVDVLQFRLI